jgi:hypothetical protein
LVGTDQTVTGDPVVVSPEHKLPVPVKEKSSAREGNRILEQHAGCPKDDLLHFLHWWGKSSACLAERTDPVTVLLFFLLYFLFDLLFFGCISFVGTHAGESDACHSGYQRHSYDQFFHKPGILELKGTVFFN